MTDDRIHVTASFTVADLLTAGSITFTITPNKPPEPDPLPPNPAEPQAD